MTISRRAFIAAAGALPLAGPMRAQTTAPLRLAELLTAEGAPSALALAQAGQRVSVTGFMAPSLRPEARFFVLADAPMALCPYCAPGMAWPALVLPVFTPGPVRVIPFNVAVRATGLLQAGVLEDDDLGFDSPLRLLGASYGRA